MLDWHQAGQAPKWLNLEYLSAEDYVERSHLLPSPQRNGLQKTFFYPGWTPRTGGLIRPYPSCKHEESGSEAKARADWLGRLGHTAALSSKFTQTDNEYWVCLFCYEPPVLADMLKRLCRLVESRGKKMRLWVCHGRSSTAVQTALASDKESAITASLTPSGGEGLRLHYLPVLPQEDFDTLVCLCDLNFVRGEDSLALAAQIGKPFVWQIYRQDDGAHIPKLDALLSKLALDTQSKLWHRWCNGILYDQGVGKETLGDFAPPSALPQAAGKATVQQIPDLIQELEHFLVCSQTAYEERLKAQTADSSR
jgi:uncharacterized repeat protein (TIGR03837 family)